MKRKFKVIERIKAIMKDVYLSKTSTYSFFTFLKLWEKYLSIDDIKEYVNWQFPEKLIDEFGFSQLAEYSATNVSARVLGSFYLLIRNKTFTEEIFNLTKDAFHKYIKLVNTLKTFFKKKDILYYEYHPIDDFDKDALDLGKFFKFLNQHTTAEQHSEIENIINLNIDIFCDFAEREYNLADYCYETPIFLAQEISDNYTFSENFIINNKSLLIPNSLLINNKYNTEIRRIIYKDVLPCYLSKMVKFKTHNKVEKKFSISDDDIDLILLQRNLME